MGEKDKPPDILQADGTLSEKNAGSENVVGGSSGGSSPREAILENGKENRKWSTLFGIRPFGKSSLPLVKNISDLTGGNVEILALPKGLLTFAFSCEEDKIRILCGSPWLVGKTALVLQKWHPILNMSDSLLVQVSVWVKLPGLPLEYWVESIFSSIASSFGELLSIDPVTTSRRRLTHARFCVGITHDVDMPEQIDIVSKLGMWKQQIEYKSIPFSCFHCKKVVHWAKHCPLKPKGENKKDKSIAESKKAPEKKIWQVKNSETDLVDTNSFGPLGENKDVVSSTSISNHLPPTKKL
ncbi:uncharacterized protein LOC131874245 [Cryptomeria japonica]|uniref:uncharacterized protein LOC131874245 n=1 Tax=Cryptomeria japonica TaxID=3369 RepID=UPI0027DA40A8|nr:uncharacterized protein LOC131874245 [Cryptomeria japonica]